MLLNQLEDMLEGTQAVAVSSEAMFQQMRNLSVPSSIIRSRLGAQSPRRDQAKALSQWRATTGRLQTTAAECRRFHAQ